jgi:hypothetical protein
MTKILELPLQQLDWAAVQALKNEFPNAIFRVESDFPSTVTPMDEDQFWSIIALFDWSKDQEDDILAPSVLALSQLSDESIFGFHELLNQKLFALDARKYAEQLGSNRFAPAEGNFFSVDDFLYSRCGVIANGRQFFDEVLETPSLILKEFTFESLLYLPEKAWEAKHSNVDYDYFPVTSYETFSNIAGWPGMRPLKDRLNKR